MYSLFQHPSGFARTWLEPEKQRGAQGKRQTEDFFKKQRHNPPEPPNFPSFSSPAVGTWSAWNKKVMNEGIISPEAHI